MPLFINATKTVRAVTLYLGLALGLAHAQTAPTTRILVGFPPGQATDSVARLLSEKLSQSLGQTMIVDNRPGQGGSLALTQLSRSPNDGSVITLSALAAYVINPYLYKGITYDSVRDFEPISLVADLPMVLVVNPALPVKTLKEFIAYATNNPDKLSHSSAGNGTISHLAMEDLKARAGLKILHVPYQGSPRAMTDLVAGTVQVGIDTLAVTKPLVKAGRLRMLAVGTKQRLPDFPDVPTIAESGFTDFEAVAWIGLAAPSGTPRVLRVRMQAEVAKTLQDPSMGFRLADLGAVPRPSSIDEFGVFLRSEQRRWKDVVTRSGVKVD